MDTLTGPDDQKLVQIKEILLNAVDEMEILVYNTERKLIEEVSTVEDVVKKKENCTTVIALGRLLKDFPKKSKYEPRQFVHRTVDPRVLDFLEKMDKAIYTVKSKFEVIKDFVHTTTSLTNALTLALVLRDAKKVILQQEVEEDEEKDKTRKASVNEIEAERNLQQRAILSLSQVAFPDSPVAPETKPEPTFVPSSPTTPTKSREEEEVVPPESVQMKVNEALNFKKGTLRRPRSTSAAASIVPNFETPPPAPAPRATMPNFAECIENLLSVQEDSLELLLKDPSGIKLFRAYLKKEFAEDNLKFWEEVSKFNKLKPTDKSIKKKAEEIYHTFIKDGAEQEVNLPGAIRRGIVMDFNNSNIKVTTFDVAQKSVFHLMENDSFRRFVKSDEFKQYVKSKGYQKISKKEQKKSRQINSMSVVLSTLDESSD